VFFPKPANLVGRASDIQSNIRTCGKLGESVFQLDCEFLPVLAQFQKSLLVAKARGYGTARRVLTAFFGALQSASSDTLSSDGSAMQASTYGRIAALDDRPRPGKEPENILGTKAPLLSLACRKATDLGYALLARAKESPALAHTKVEIFLQVIGGTEMISTRCRRTNQIVGSRRGPCIIAL